MLSHLLTNCQRVLVSLGKATLWNFTVINMLQDMLSLANVTVGQVSKILHSMSSSKATGLDEIPAKYLKDGSSVISKLLTHIINLSRGTGSIPDDLWPGFPYLSKTQAGNYISVLSVISKVFEKVVFMQLSDYFSENRLLYHYFNLVFGRLIPLTHV